MTEQVMRRHRRKILTDKMVAALPRRRKRYTVTDPEMSGHYVRVSPTGPRVFAAICRDVYGKQKWIKIGDASLMMIDEARDKAKAAIKRVKEGLPPVESPPVKPDSFQDVAENWLKRHVVKKGLRSQADVERVLRKYVMPRWGSRAFTSIKRSDVTALLDHIEDNSGARMADVVLAIIRTIANWHTKRDDDYVSPVARGIRRDTAKPRDRILDDDEIRAVWKAAEADGTFGALVRVLLCCGQRRAKVESMKFSDVSDAGIWTIQTAEREKSNAGTLRLSPAVLSIIAARPRLGNNPYVFASLRGDGPITGMSKLKAHFDKQCGVTGWTLHDLRRTSRSLMSRANIRPDIAERVLGHAIGGIKGVYDRHDYSHEKADALLKLAAMLETIINPPTDNVVTLRQPVQP
jgi:integrase